MTLFANNRSTIVDQKSTCKFSVFSKSCDLHLNNVHKLNVTLRMFENAHAVTAYIFHVRQG